MRILPSGSRVAECPERGSSIGVAGETVPTRGAEDDVLWNALAAMAELIVIEAMRSRREWVMMALLESETNGVTEG
jgi:hypothetical protein